jgi:hypothetical protein
MGIVDPARARGGKLLHMASSEQPSIAGDVNGSDTATLATPTPQIVNSHEPDTSGNGDAGDATLTALADDLEYTLTVGQALELMIAAGRKAPSERSLQRYCIEGRLAAKKIRTIFGAEWLINETSLAQLIEIEPIVTGDAGDANSSDAATLATPTPPIVNSHEPDTSGNGDAGDASHLSMATPIGEKRTIAEVLIENARLLAQVEGRDAIIHELKEDRSFLREEVREGRQTRDDVKSIAEQMLDTLKTMAIGRLAMPTQPLRTEYIPSSSIPKSGAE